MRQGNGGTAARGGSRWIGGRIVGGRGRWGQAAGRTVRSCPAGGTAATGCRDGLSVETQTGSFLPARRRGSVCRRDGAAAEAGLIPWSRRTGGRPWRAIARSSVLRRAGMPPGADGGAARDARRGVGVWMRQDETGARWRGRPSRGTARAVQRDGTGRSGRVGPCARRARESGCRRGDRRRGATTDKADPRPARRTVVPVFPGTWRHGRRRPRRARDQEECGPGGTRWLVGQARGGCGLAAWPASIARNGRGPYAPAASARVG